MDKRGAQLSDISLEDTRLQPIKTARNTLQPAPAHTSPAPQISTSPCRLPAPPDLCLTPPRESAHVAPPWAHCTQCPAGSGRSRSQPRTCRCRVCVVTGPGPPAPTTGQARPQDKPRRRGPSPGGGRRPAPALAQWELPGTAAPRALTSFKRGMTGIAKYEFL